MQIAVDRLQLTEPEQRGLAMIRAAKQRSCDAGTLTVFGLLLLGTVFGLLTSLGVGVLFSMVVIWCGVPGLLVTAFSYVIYSADAHNYVAALKSTDKEGAASMTSGTTLFDPYIHLSVEEQLAFQKKITALAKRRIKVVIKAAIIINVFFWIMAFFTDDFVLLLDAPVATLIMSAFIYCGHLWYFDDRVHAGGLTTIRTIYWE